MSLPVSLHFFKPAALVMAMAAVMPAIAQEQIQIPGMNMPVAASTQPQAFAKPTPSPESVPERQEDPQEEKKPRLVAITPGSAENPSVPASVVKKPTPVQPVESRQDVVVASGTNTLIPISRGQINRLVTPFDNPHIQTVSEAEISTSGNVIYVTTQDEKPVTMFVTPEDDESVAISLTLLPQGVPPIQANLILAKNVQGLASGMPITSSTNYSGQARKWERSQPYMDTLRSLMREMALGKLPRAPVYEQAFDSNALQSAGFSGAGTALERIADFYLEMAESIFPVIEIDAMRDVDFIVNKGMTVKFNAATLKVNDVNN